jgi:hypothetical protein
LEKKPQKSQSDALQDRKRLTFEQAEGVEPLPAQLQLKELSPALRAALWAVVLRSVDEAVDSDSWGGSRVGGLSGRIISAESKKPALHSVISVTETRIKARRPIRAPA